MSTLKPCPFCGGAAQIERPGTARQSCIIACEDCGARLESNEEGDGCGDNWNTRAPHTAPLPAVPAASAAVGTDLLSDCLAALMHGQTAEQSVELQRRIRAALIAAPSAAPAAAAPPWRLVTPEEPREGEEAIGMWLGVDGKPGAAGLVYRRGPYWYETLGTETDEPVRAPSHWMPLPSAPAAPEGETHPTPTESGAAPAQREEP